VVNISSVHSVQAFPGAHIYDAAKSGLVGLSRALAVELAAAVPPVRVNAVSPGLVATEIWDKMLEVAADKQKCEAEWMANVPMGRTIAAQEVCGPVLFLLSAAASAVTGHNLVVDAGMTAQLISTQSFASANIGASSSSSSSSSTGSSSSAEGASGAASSP
jgi:NAD(P)-dependent dehydrogenase (short-subunit alcohol dehydrogenase family)